MKIYAIRHGLTEFNILGKINGQISDDPLTKEGVTEARGLALSMPQKIEKIYSSDFLRTKQTAEIINEYCKAEISFDPDLREVNFGSLAGKTKKEMAEVAGRDIFNVEYKKQKYDFRPWGGESVENVQARIIRCMAKIKEESATKCTLIVTSGGIVRALYFIYKNQLLDKVENLSIHEFEV